MRLIVCDDLAALNASGADEIAAVVGNKPTAAVVLATGNSPMGIYSELAGRTARGAFAAGDLRVFQLDEYFDLPDGDNRTLYGWMDRSFLQPMRVPLQNVVRLRAARHNWREECQAYDDAVKAAGGFELAVLGLGANGHLGFNEPGSHAHTKTRALMLSEASIDSNAAYWGDRKLVPQFAVTCGMRNLLQSKRIILVVTGEKKREILERALYGDIGPEVPASYLQEHPDLVVICDKSAAPRRAGGNTDSQSPIEAPSVHTKREVRTDLVLGIDGGNSKTVAVLAERSGRIIGYGRGGCGDMYGATPAGALQAVNNAVQTAFDLAGIPASTVGAAAFSMAGADWPEDYALLAKMFTEAQYAQQLTIVNDSVGALRAGSAQGWGVGVVLGSWAATTARSRKGTWEKSSWQPAGGGGALAHQAIEAVYKAEMGLGPQTRLTAKVLAYFGVDSALELLHQFTKREGPHPQSVQRLAPAVLDAALEGDATAIGIALDQGRTMGTVAISLAHKVGIERQAFPLVLAGSIFRHQCQLLPDALVSTVKAHSPRAQASKSDLEPVAGAVKLAVELSGRRCDRRFRERLKRSMPDASFFAT